MILDHDDTAVDSSGSIHHPAHRKTMEILRPGVEPIDLNTWFAKNFHPGIMQFLVGEIGLTPDEIEVEHKIWREFTENITPSFYPGFLEALTAYQAAGGFIAVVSHSEEHVIRDHYSRATNGHKVTPDLVFGWDLGTDKRKPAPYPVLECLRHFRLSQSEALVVDDLKPGIDMARAAGVDAAAACWSHDIPEIRAFMKTNCVATFETVQDFAEFVLL